jgi:hypothetical protein
MDIEASSLGEDSFPVSIGVLDANNESNNYEAIIRPIDAWDDWSEEAEEIHGISHGDLMSTGVSVCHVCNELNCRFAFKTIYVDSVFDLFWINRLYEAAKAKPKFLVSHIKKVVDKERYDEFLYDLQESDLTHKPLEDARVLYKVSKGYIK